MTTIEVLTSGIWQTTTTIVASARSCLIIDPAYFPRELAAIRDRARQLGEVTAVAFTHGHWDHVMGYQAMPPAPLWLARTLDAKIASGSADRYLEDARQFDSRWYVPRPHGYRWPSQRRPIDDDERLIVGRAELRALHLPGHSSDGLGLVVDGALLAGDYLSPLEIPFVEDAVAYRATLDRLIALSGELAEIIPGHGPRLTVGEALAIARADRDYVDRLIEARDRASALAIEWPRAHQVVGMYEHHVENVDARFG